MNRDFEIRQLLRAYRGGIMSEAAFEEEMTRIEHEVAEPGAITPSFEALGRTYRSEREAVIDFLDKLHATQMDGAVGFAKWSAVCRTRGLRTGLMIVAERKAYHARVLERRAHELGAELRTISSEQGSKLVEVLANGEISELEKLLALTTLIQEPRAAVAPLMAFAAALNTDIETKQALRLLAEDELSSATWLSDVYGALSAGQVPPPKIGVEQLLRNR